MVSHAKEALALMGARSLDEYKGNRGIQLQVERLLEIVGEAANGVSAKVQATIDIDWRNIKAMRNILVHQYGRLDHDRVYRVVFDRLPTFIEVIEPLIRP